VAEKLFQKFPGRRRRHLRGVSRPRFQFDKCGLDFTVGKHGVVSWVSRFFQLVSCS
jgi:hypothetical protein